MPVELALPAKSVERERLNSLVNSMADGVIAVDEHLKIVISNGAALNILDLNITLAGKSITRVLHLVNKNNHKIDVGKLIRDTKTPQSSRDWKIIYPDSSRANLYTSIAPVRLGYGQRGMRGYVILLRDITREKSLEEERDEFISVASHELRTPITIAEGNISNAQFIFQNSGLKDPTVQQALKEAHNQINFLAGLINDLSMLARAERGKLTVEIEPINTHNLLEELTEDYKSQTQAKGVDMRTEPDPGLELLQSSRLYVREILQNFITNAIKYTEKGHVTLGARPKKGGTEFYVVDTGIGISKSDQEKLFDKFFRSEDYRTRESSGTGLGLYITLKLARLLHAKIDVKSELNKGSTFTIFIPNLQ